MESTYSGRPGPELVERAIEAGYRIEGIYIGTANPEINIERIRTRVENNTGHHVDPERVPDRYRHSLHNLRRTADRFDELTIVDNTEERERGIPDPRTELVLEKGRTAWETRDPRKLGDNVEGKIRAGNGQPAPARREGRTRRSLEIEKGRRHAGETTRRGTTKGKRSGGCGSGPKQKEERGRHPAAVIKARRSRRTAATLNHHGQVYARRYRRRAPRGVETPSPPRSLRRRTPCGVNWVVGREPESS